ncbi:MAG TPA: hypothetical protein VFS36_07325 [Chitinophagaceae bacterium]|jgi:hypothetical protein|nr:hypothetical protein [Chitinophagaceae bacterium]
MKSAYRQLVRGWNVLKVLKVVLAGMSIVAGIQGHDIVLAIAGSSFLLFTLFVNGACCYHYSTKPGNDKIAATDWENSNYEELGSK